ncbi:MAG: DNA internalization-related competence protein ComEC/Rec2 [Vicinamibacteria bacterium]|nr:DNA internalization-related competence protein ComEC/Rec2 [Vicinamibacteria bacterium]
MLGELAKLWIGPLFMASILLLLLAQRVANPRTASLALLAAALGAGALGAEIERRHYYATPLRQTASAQRDTAEPVEVSGVLARDPMRNDDLWILVLDVFEVSERGVGRASRGRVRVAVGGQAQRPELLEGDAIALWTRLQPPRGFRNPGVDNWEDRARFQGIHATGYCKSALLIRRLEQPRRWRGWLAETRCRARSQLELVLPDGPELAIVKAMVLGDRDDLDDATEDSFRAAGTYHVLAISGAQVALIAALWHGLLALAGCPRLPKALCTCVVLLLYACFVGGDIPVWRAALMAIVVVIGQTLDQQSRLANLLGLAALLILAAHPGHIWDLGFELSFGATLAILHLTKACLARLPHWPLKLEVILAASLAAQAGVLPLTIARFHRIPLAALPLNLLAVPISAAVLLFGLSALIAISIGLPGGIWLADAAWIAAHTLIRSARWAEMWPALNWTVPTPPFWAVLCFVCGLWAVAYPGRLRRGWALMLCGGLGLTGLFTTPQVDGRLVLTAVDVGDGECLILRSPRGRTIVVDSGGLIGSRMDIGERVIAPYLWSQGIARIHATVLTHCHPDHYGGLARLWQDFPVAEFWYGTNLSADCAGTQTLASYASLRPRRLLSGESIDWDGATLTAVWPPQAGTEASFDLNRLSMVLSVRYREVSLLLTADIDTTAEGRLSLAPHDVVKVPHHGSRTSSSMAFVSALRPRIALVSVGAQNRSGHPRPEVLARYLSVGASIYRTDRDGAVTIATDGRRLWIETTHSQ